MVERYDAENDRQRMLLEDIDPDNATLEELCRFLVDHHVTDQGFLGAVARRADELLKEMGE